MRIATKAESALLMRYFYAINFAKEKAVSLAKTDKACEVKMKSDSTLVTGLDEEISRSFVHSITKHPLFSQDEIISEERKNQFNQQAEHLWIIDPIDGTANFANQRVSFALSIGYWQNHEPTFGLIVQTGTKGLSLLTAFRGQGVSINGQPTAISPSAPVRMMGGIDLKNSARDPLVDIFPRLYGYAGEMRIPGSIVCGLADVALGRLSFYVHSGPRIWDVAAALVFLRETGRVTNLDNIDPVEAAKKDFKLPLMIAAQDQAMLKEVSGIVQKTRI